MNTFAQGFVFILMLSIGDATQGPLAPKSGRERLMRKEAVQIDAASVMQHIHSVGSKEQHSRRSEIEGVIEQGGKCLAAKIHQTHSEEEEMHEEHTLHMVKCASEGYHETWTAFHADEPVQIKLELGEEEDMEHPLLCLQDVDGFVKLEPCVGEGEETHHLQLFTYSAATNEIEITTDCGERCVTVLEEESDGVVKLALAPCAVAPIQEFVFEQPLQHHHVKKHHGKIQEHSLPGAVAGPARCISAHKMSNGEKDLEVVECGKGYYAHGEDGDGLDYEEFAFVAHDEHATKHQIKLCGLKGCHDSVEEETHDDSASWCFTADAAFHMVHLSHCHTHTLHERQLWIYDEGNHKFKMETEHGDKCMAGEPEQPEHNDGIILTDCTHEEPENSLEEWKWVVPEEEVPEEEVPEEEKQEEEEEEEEQ